MVDNGTASIDDLFCDLLQVCGYVDTYHPHFNWVAVDLMQSALKLLQPSAIIVCMNHTEYIFELLTSDTGFSLIGNDLIITFHKHSTFYQHNSLHKDKVGISAYRFIAEALSPISKGVGGIHAWGKTSLDITAEVEKVGVVDNQASLCINLFDTVCYCSTTADVVYI